MILVYVKKLFAMHWTFIFYLASGDDFCSSRNFPNSLDITINDLLLWILSQLFISSNSFAPVTPRNWNLLISTSQQRLPFSFWFCAILKSTREQCFLKCSLHGVLDETECARGVKYVKLQWMYSSHSRAKLKVKSLRSLLMYILLSTSRNVGKVQQTYSLHSFRQWFCIFTDNFSLRNKRIITVDRGTYLLVAKNVNNCKHKST